jgi:hypothetical protein
VSQAVATGVSWRVYYVAASSPSTLRPTRQGRVQGAAKLLFCTMDVTFGFKKFKVGTK